MTVACGRKDRKHHKFCDREELRLGDEKTVWKAERALYKKSAVCAFCVSEACNRAAFDSLWQKRRVFEPPSMSNNFVSITENGMLTKGRKN